LNELIHSGEAVILKVIFFYSDRSEECDMILDYLYLLANEYTRLRKHAFFARMNVDKNEVPELAEMDVPSLVVIKGYGDEEATNYEGSWDRASVKEFLDEKM